MWSVAIELCKLLRSRSDQDLAELTVDDYALIYAGASVRSFCGRVREFEVWLPLGRFEYAFNAKDAAKLVYESTHKQSTEANHG